MLLKDKIIIIVEDNLLNRVTYQVALMRDGARVIFERWGKDLHMILQQHPEVDLIILDLMLPYGQSGYKHFEDIRQIPGFERVPIIAVSAAEPSYAMARCRELGFDGYIAKPINEANFGSLLARIMQGEQIWSIH